MTALEQHLYIVLRAWTPPTELETARAKLIAELERRLGIYR